MRRAMAESKRRELQLQIIRELDYRRRLVATLLDQCREVEERCKPDVFREEGNRSSAATSNASSLPGAKDAENLIEDVVEVLAEVVG